ncbi:cytochrome p450 4v2-like [Dermatophagoides farinae]|uniref:Cytochrome p450 4v2-like n=1 Tax=Dermatophagoides farinae TaxID=6954 RepID=A0A9D4P4R4_DERFA|nr:cytochrome p450 4v2-like [Dermatophagoides farinae]
MAIFIGNLNCLLNQYSTTIIESQSWEKLLSITTTSFIVSSSSLIKYMILISLFAFIIISIVRRQYQLVSIVNKIPGPPVNPWVPWLGHAYIVLDLDRCHYQHGTYALIYQMVSSVNKIYQQEGICRMWIGLKPLVLLYRPDDVEVILNSNTLTQKSAEYRFLNSWLGEGLVTSGRQKWRSRHFLPIINEQSNILVAKLNRLTTNANNDTIEMDVVPIITLCMLDIICETAMGVKLNLQANSNHEYVEALYNISRIFLIRLMRPWLWPNITFNISSYGRLFNRSVEQTKNFTMKVIKERRNEWMKFLSNHNHNDDEHESMVDDFDMIKTSKFFKNSNRLAFLDLLLQHHLVTKKLTLEDLREEVDTFMFAGHDTTSHAISWTLYMLGIHQDIQQKVRDEIDMVFDCSESNIDLSIDEIKQLKYLDCVIKEVQRIYPTAPFIGRDLSEDTKINGYIIPKGTTVGIFTYVLHRDPEIYPEPEKFLPERFLPENCSGRHPFSFIPFSAGPRNCIGQKFAMNEVKIVIAKIIRHFYLRSIDPRDKLVIVGEMILRSINGLKISFIQRKLEQTK